MTNKYNDEIIWFNGEIICYSKARINIMNTSAQYGINVFEGIRGYYINETKEICIFKLQEHLKRLLESAKLLRLELEENITIEYLTNSVKDLIKANSFKEDIYIKIGVFIDDEGSWNALGPTGIYILAFPKGRVYPNRKGLNCCVSTWRRISDSVISPRIKSGANYINSRYAYLESRTNGYDAPIFLNDKGKVAEGAGACIFIVRNGKLITPSITSSILESITREVVIYIAKNNLKIDVVEREVDRTELYVADEAFFVGTTIEIVPILSIDQYEITERIGGLSERIRTVFMKTVRDNRIDKNSLITEKTF